ncbi:hypothetical protein [Sulfurivirga sp.]|uniref:hypothetical protein n=1 Tax=Sulfurivirga sp. TaxID=2614236 RepID=UPI0025EF32BF|nr:hypothetical protein [Sulfurivirga sp.]
MTYIAWPTIQPDQFLPIFLYASFVLVFGALYAALITAGKMGFYRYLTLPLGYAMWGAQAWCLYALSVLIQANAFTYKVLAITMIAYLFVPHLYFQLIDQSETRHQEEESHESA